MRLIGAAHVRNEADIVEAFLRRNLTALDGLAIVDHGSVDATPGILHALGEEGLPLFVARERRRAFPPGRAASGYAKRRSDSRNVIPRFADGGRTPTGA